MCTIIMKYSFSIIFMSAVTFKTSQLAFLGGHGKYNAEYKCIFHLLVAAYKKPIVKLFSLYKWATFS